MLNNLDKLMHSIQLKQFRYLTTYSDVLSRLNEQFQHCTFGSNVPRWHNFTKFLQTFSKIGPPSNICFNKFLHQINNDAAFS